MRPDTLEPTLHNAGTLRLQVIDFTVARVDGAKLATQTTPSYVLSGAERSWLLVIPADAPGSLRISARTDQGDIAADVQADGP